MKFKKVGEMNFKEYLFEMSNIRGDKVKIEDIGFSFYFSSKNNATCGQKIRVKICWNKEKLSFNLLDGYMELCGKYEYVSKNKPNNKPSQNEIEKARNFFKKYKILFSAVWEEKLDENVLNDYLRGTMNFEELLNEFENISMENKEKIGQAKSLEELNKIVRENGVFNLNE